MAHALRARWPGGLTRLDWLLSRYWDAAEADLAYRGIDLLAAFQACRVRYLLVVLMALPRNTLTQEAMSQDDELVEQLMDGRDEDDVPQAIRMAEFSAEVEALYGVADRLGDVLSAQIAAGGKKAPRIPALKRPETAWQRVNDRKHRARHLALVGALVPQE